MAEPFFYPAIFITINKIKERTALWFWLLPNQAVHVKITPMFDFTRCNFIYSMIHLMQIIKCDLFTEKVDYAENECDVAFNYFLLISNHKTWFDFFMIKSFNFQSINQPFAFHFVSATDFHPFPFAHPFLCDNFIECNKVTSNWQFHTGSIKLGKGDSEVILWMKCRWLEWWKSIGDGSGEWKGHSTATNPLLSRW